jgi:hypothetical protein
MARSDFGFLFLKIGGDMKLCVWLSVLFVCFSCDQVQRITDIQGNINTIVSGYSAGVVGNACHEIFPFESGDSLGKPFSEIYLTLLPPEDIQDRLGEFDFDQVAFFPASWADGRGESDHSLPLSSEYDERTNTIKITLEKPVTENGKYTFSMLTFSTAISGLKTSVVKVNFDIYFLHGDVHSNNPAKPDKPGDGRVDLADLGTILSEYGMTQPRPQTCFASDLNDDGVVDLSDLGWVLTSYGLSVL